VPKPKKNLFDMEIDEVSLVDKGANQFAMVAIAKRAPEEDQMPKLYNESGQLLDENSLEYGDVVYDEEGAAYEFVMDDEDEMEIEDERELAEVGKSAFFQPTPTTGFAASVMEELSKAFTDEDRDQIIAKALGRVEELESAQNEAVQIAKAERDLRLEREYIAKADDYGLPVQSEELGPVMKRMAEELSYEDCAVIHKCLEAAGAALFTVIGADGGGANSDVMEAVTAYSAEAFGKSADEIDEATVAKAFDMNPDAYDQYLSAQRGI
jgi:hypothetical protein